jgi:hypothetical protein
VNVLQQPVPRYEHRNTDKAAERRAVRSARKYQGEAVEPYAGLPSHHAGAGGGIERDSGVVEYDHGWVSCSKAKLD